MLEIPKFETQKELFNFLIENKDNLCTQKKAETKCCDGVSFRMSTIDKDGKANKANEPITLTDDINEIKVRVVINTTNLMDSHLDVHLPGLWTKSLSENKNIMHIQEHTMRFANIIASGKDIKAYTKTMSWSELGFKYDGDTQALIFDSIIRKDRNPFMFEQYAKGYVTEHSVGMRYVKLLLAINDEDYTAEFEAWEKYLPEIANKETAEDKGYFWVVKEAKVIEGSAVPMGSNSATPTLENNMKGEPSEDTHNKNDNEPSGDTRKREFLIELSKK